MSNSADEILQILEGKLTADEFLRVKFFLTPIFPLIPLKELIQAADGLGDGFVESANRLKDSLEFSFSQLPSTDLTKKKLVRAGEWVYKVATAIETHREMAIINDWFTPFAKVMRGMMDEVKGENKRCLAIKRKCKECDNFQEDGAVVCDECGSLIRPCLGTAMTNGRCGFHSGNDETTRLPISLSAQRQMLIADDDRRQLMMEVMDAPDLLTNAADIAALEFRQQGLFEAAIDGPDPQMAQKLFVKKTKALAKAIEGNNVAEALAILDSINNESGNSDRFWGMYQVNAKLLSDLRKVEHDRILKASATMTLTVYEKQLQSFRDAIVRALGTFSSRLPDMLVAELQDSGDDYMLQRLPVFLNGDVANRVEREVRQLVLGEVAKEMR